MRLVPLIVVLGSILFTSQADAAFFGLLDSTKNVTAKDGKITIDVSELAKVNSRHYRYKEGGKVVKFFIVRDGQGTVRAALDACDVCWKAGKGYALKDKAMLCVNCGMMFPLARIGAVSGGCNPHPFRFNVENDSVVIATQELMLGINYFPENR